MPRSISYTATPVFLVTAGVWVTSLWNHTFYAKDFWFYVVMFLAPGGLVCVCAWLIFTDRVWTRVLGALLVLPCLGIWILSLMLAYGEFRIH